ncbi:MAG: AbrB/MazE/SpoVT family DNA-binding domain-containing protein [Candidatus Paceibacterota bacterium]
MNTYNAMADKKYKDRNIRKVTKNGTSHSVSIPVEMLKKLGWRERQKVVVTMRGKKLTIEDWRPKRKKRLK